MGTGALERLRPEPGRRGGNGGRNRRHLGREQRQRHVDERDSQGGRQHVRVQQRRHATHRAACRRDNLTDELRARGVTTTSQGPALLRCQRDRGRSDQAGPAVVLRRGPGGGQPESAPGVYFNATQGTPFYTPTWTAAVSQGVGEERRRPADLAGVGEKQDERLCRRPGLLQSGTGRIRLARRRSGCRSTSGRRGCSRSAGARQ